MTLSVHGRSHRLLARLTDGECGFPALYDAMHAGVWTEARRRKAHRLIDALERDGMIARGERVFFILPLGEAELARLDREAAGQVSVRVFRRAA